MELRVLNGNKVLFEKRNKRNKRMDRIVSILSRVCARELLKTPAKQLLCTISAFKRSENEEEEKSKSL